jgi:hypothetical protein
MIEITAVEGLHAERIRSPGFHGIGFRNMELPAGSQKMVEVIPGRRAFDLSLLFERDRIRGVRVDQFGIQDHV